jgi:multiple sugar transport system ATP-binding protein
MASVSLKNIQKAYPCDSRPQKEGRLRRQAGRTRAGFQAVRAFNLEIADGEFIALVGPSGCGKTTALRMIAGLEEIDSGDLLIDGQRMNDVEAQERDISIVFQNCTLYPHITVYENMALPLKQQKLPPEEIDRRIRNAAEALGIACYLDRKPRTLSGGQCQQVALGRAIVREPKVLLLDEPLSNLDARLRHRMCAALNQLRQSLDTTFVYVTQYLSEAMALSDRIVVMKEGAIQQAGTPDEVMAHPANRFVADFLEASQMNFLDGTLVKRKGKYAVEVGGMCVELSDGKQARLDANCVEPQPITLGIAPEHLLLSDGSAPTLHGTVAASEHTGGATHLRVDGVANDTILGVQILNIPAAQTGRFSVGQSISLTFNGNAAHLFSKDGGRNLEY